MEEINAQQSAYLAFIGHELIARGELVDVVLACKARVDQGACERVAVFEGQSGRVFDIDLSGSTDDIKRRLVGEEVPPDQPRKRGRPKLGVVSREVSLLPRHWEWLGSQRGGASATLRRIVEQARKNESGPAKAQQAVEAAHRFLWDIAADLPNFKQATRHLFAFDFESLRCAVSGWPADLRQELARFVDRAALSLSADNEPKS